MQSIHSLFFPPFKAFLIVLLHPFFHLFFYSSTSSSFHLRLHTSIFSFGFFHISMGFGPCIFRGILPHFMPNYSCIQLLITQKPPNPISYFAKKRHILSVGFVEIEKVEEIGERERIFFAAFSVFVICDFDFDLFYMSFYFELVNC